MPTFYINNNQKEVLEAVISGHINNRAAHSLLDIGAGDGYLAKRLAPKVRRYLAMETKSERVAELRRASLSVVEGQFPNIPVTETFDIVLSSHSLPEGADDYKPFLEIAWQLVAPGGELVIVTFKGAHDELWQLTRKLRPGWVDDDQPKYEEMMAILGKWGKPSITSVTSYSATSDKDEMMRFLTWSIGGSETLKGAYQSVLGDYLAKQQESGTYCVGHQHLVVSMSKES